MEADERCSEAAANGRRKREECRKMAQEARQTALKHTHKLPRRLWDDEKERTHPPVRGRPQGGEECGPSCRERRTLWKEELSSLSTLLAVITPSEGAESGGEPGWYTKWNGEPGMEGILNMDYWMVLPVIVMVVTGLIMRIRRHLGEVWKPGDDGSILARVGEPTFPWTGEGQLPRTSQESAAGRTQVRLGYSCSAAGECAAEAIFCCPAENSHHLKS
jgi:hypothetical protein